MRDQHKSAIVTSESASPLCQSTHESDSLVPQRHGRSRRKQQPGPAQASLTTVHYREVQENHGPEAQASMLLDGLILRSTVSEKAGVVRREKNL